MSVLKKLALVMLMALWVPATSHCVLAALSGIEALECCPEETQNCQPYHESDCAAEICITVEAGFYKTDSEQVTAPEPVLTTVLFVCLASELEPDSSMGDSLMVSGPPELRPSLHFRTRAALPARAPTLPC